jgi:hypothetical protein
LVTGRHLSATLSPRLQALPITPQKSPTNQSISLTADPQTTDSLRTFMLRESVSLAWSGPELPSVSRS